MLVYEHSPGEMFVETEDGGEFVTPPASTFNFEHSLFSISEWEMKYHRSFLDSKEFTMSEIMDYYEMMCLTPGFSKDIVDAEMHQALQDYMFKTKTATVINNAASSGKQRISAMTSDVIYGLMANAQIPFTCDRWHIAKLMSVLGVVSVLNAPEDKGGDVRQTQIDKYNKNEELKKKYGTSG